MPQKFLQRNGSILYAQWCLTPLNFYTDMRKSIERQKEITFALKDKYEAAVAELDALIQKKGAPKPGTPKSNPEQQT